MVFMGLAYLQNVKDRFENPLNINKLTQYDIDEYLERVKYFNDTISTTVPAKPKPNED
jgi:hypothetical protein